MQWVYCSECLAYPLGMGCPLREEFEKGDINDEGLG